MNYNMPERKQNSHKGTFGKVLNVAGSNNYIGAAFLSTISALKIGAGFVALSTNNRVIDSVSKLLPEAVFLSRKDGLKKVNEFNVMLIGCGLGLSNNSKNDFIKFIKLATKYDLPTVIDADGLNILSKLNNITLPSKTIITPHPLEAARLLKVDTVLNDLETAAKELSYKYSCVTILKTHKTLICEKENIFKNQNGNSALAKAGTGDVLAGILSGLLAQKMPPFESAKLGVYLHARAGEIASEKLTEYSVLASDVINNLPFAINELL